MNVSKEDIFLNWLVEQGAVEIVSIREDGEFLYAMTPACKDIAPEFYEEWVSGTNEIVRSLWEKNMISLAWTDDDVLVTLTEDSFDEAKVLELDQFEYEILMEIINDFADQLVALDGPSES